MLRPTTLRFPAFRDCSADDVPRPWRSVGTRVINGSHCTTYLGSQAAGPVYKLMIKGKKYRPVKPPSDQPLVA